MWRQTLDIIEQMLVFPHCILHKLMLVAAQGSHWVKGGPDLTIGWKNAPNLILNRNVNASWTVGADLSAVPVGRLLEGKVEMQPI